MDDNVDYFKQIKEEILCEDIKPPLINKESGNVMTYTGYELKSSVKIDSFENVTIKNEKVVNLEDLNRTLVSKSSVPMNGNENFNVLENLHKNETEFLYSAWTKEKELKLISNEGRNKTNEQEEHQEIISNARNNISKSFYRCDLCQQNFKLIFDLKKHLLRHSRPHSCYVCKTSFAQKGHLTSHMLIHTGIKPNICHVCNSSFTHKGTLTNHMFIHTGDKPHICHVCNSSFARKDSLAKHMLIHTGDKPHICHVCNSSFARKDSLASHMLIHTRERSHRCHVCVKSFSQKSNLTKHLRIHTRQDQTFVPPVKNQIKQQVV